MTAFVMCSNGRRLCPKGRTCYRVTAAPSVNQLYRAFFNRNQPGCAHYIPAASIKERE